MNYKKIEHLSQELRFFLISSLSSPYAASARAVVAGEAQGVILGDDDKEPQEVWIATQDRIWWQPLKKISHEPLDVSALLPWLKDEWKESVSIYSDPSHLDILKKRLEKLRCFCEPALIFKKDLHEFTHERISLPPQISIFPYTSHFIQTKIREEDQEDALENAQKVTQRVLGKFPGYFLVNEQGRLVSSCTLDYIHGNTCEIGVETEEDFQRQGMSTICVHHVLQELYIRGITNILWHAPKINIASQKTAQKCGFKLLFETSFLSCSTTLAHNILHCGYRNMCFGETQKAIELYEEAIKVGQEEGNSKLGEFTYEDVLGWIQDLKKGF